MEAVATVAAPVFSVMIIGYLSGRVSFFEAAAVGALNRYVFHFALPAFLFGAMFRAPLAQILDLSFLIALCAPMLATLLASLAVGRWLLRRSSVDLAMEGGTAVYGNVGYMGIPLVLMTFGERALPQAVASVVVTGSLVLAATVMVVEAQRAVGGSRWAALGRMGRSLIRNPLLVAPVLGGLLAGFDLPPPGWVRGVADLMGASASPCALFTLGLFLSGQSLRSEIGGVAWITALKLAAMPIATWLLTRYVLSVDPLTAQIALLLNALPCGAGACVVAQNYQLRTAQVSGAVLLSTVLSVLSVAGLLATMTAR